MHTTDPPDNDAPSGSLGDPTLDRLLGVDSGRPVALPRVERTAVPVESAKPPRGLWDAFIAGPRHDPDGRWHDGLISVLCWSAMAAVLLALCYLTFRGLQVFNAI